MWKIKFCFEEKKNTPQTKNNSIFNDFIPKNFTKFILWKGFIFNVLILCLRFNVNRSSNYMPNRQTLSYAKCLVSISCPCIFIVWLYEMYSIFKWEITHLQFSYWSRLVVYYLCELYGSEQQYQNDNDVLTYRP